MKKNILLFVLTTGSCCNLFAQEPSLKETQDWIKEKIEHYPSEGYSYKVEFDDQTIIITTTYHLDSNNISDEKITIQIPIYNLQPIAFEEKEHSILLHFKMKDSKVFISFYRPNQGLASWATEKSLSLSKSIKDKNLQEELKKVFNQLIAFKREKQ